ncbi:rab11 family-interacting protein 5 isoform X3 [Brachyistius frenatus]|uniref:rab11 family-interacting protein 5 isoform X3 n=1 Tax=Brachyistius frenatus TaxID=100188 RepID=UPI0037E94747
MSSLTVEEDQKWLPTHVQVTVLRGRGLRGKGKHGTSDVYTIIQLGKEKYSTCVAEKTTEPEWREECSFEVHPGVLESGGRSGYPAGANELVLTAMHRALIGLDVFLGQAVIQLDKVFHETRCVKNMWYRLNSKTGKKEKERGEIQVTVQFTRNNLTASMYDLVMKDKSASTFTKLKERIKGKRRSSEDDSSSAVLPSGYGSLYRMRQRLPSDGGGEEDYEDDEGGEARRSKMRTFFLRGKLRKSSDTRSSTSLGSESSESSSRGGSLSPTAGISVVVSDLSNSPSNSSNLTADNSPEHTANTSPKSSSLTCEFGDEAGEITIAVPQPTVCVNGSHSYQVQPPDPGSGTPAGSLGLGLLQKSLPLSVSLQNLRPDAELPRGLVGDGRRWSFDKPGEEEKAAIAAALEKSGPMLSEEEEQLGRAAPPQAASLSSASAAESDIQGKKPRRNLLSHGRSESAGKGQSRSKDESEQTAASEEKYKGWFGSKESHSKPSPHPVKPLTTAMLAEEKRSVLATGLEKFKSTIHPGRSSQLTEQETDRKKVQNQNNTANDSHYSATEGAGSYYHLTHSELVALLVHREAELNRQKAEFERQKLLLSKRELELRRLKPQVKDLEDYIDTLLVRIMEQKPTLLQVRSKFK